MCIFENASRDIPMHPYKRGRRKYCLWPCIEPAFTCQLCCLCAICVRLQRYQRNRASLLRADLQRFKPFAVMESLTALFSLSPTSPNVVFFLLVSSSLPSFKLAIIHTASPMSLPCIPTWPFTSSTLPSSLVTTL